MFCGTFLMMNKIKNLIAYLYAIKMNQEQMKKF